MKIGIDTYCFHRLFGAASPSDRVPPPSHEMTTVEFVELAHSLGAEAVSLQSLFFPRLDQAYLSEIKDLLDAFGMDRVYAWGHPNGLKGGTDDKAYDEMLEHLEYAKAIGADVMRVVGGYEVSRREHHEARLDNLARMFGNAAKVARATGVRMGQEDHNEYNSDQLLRLIRGVDSPYYGVTFDTGNFVRVLDDPVQAAKKLGQYTFATHIKDVNVDREIPADEWNFFNAVPIGEGIVDIAEVIRVLLGSGYTGSLAVEVDSIHSEFWDVSREDNEMRAVVTSLQSLKNICDSL